MIMEIELPAHHCTHTTLHYTTLRNKNMSSVRASVCVCVDCNVFLWYLRLKAIYSWHPNKINIEMAIQGGNKRQHQVKTP